MIRAIVVALCLGSIFIGGLRPAYAEMSSTPPDFAEVQRRYTVAQEAYSQGDYRRVIELVSPLVYPGQQLATMDQAIDAYRMLGVSYVFEKKSEQAEQAFLAILAERPTYSLDPLVEPAAAIELFAAVKRRNAQVLKRIEANQRAEELRRAAEQRRRLQTDRDRLPAMRSAPGKSYVLNYVPFGAGQFQNGEKSKGWLLLGSEAVLGATSLACSLALRFSFPANRTPSTNRTGPEALNITQVTTGVLFWATVVYGIADALIHYKRPAHFSGGSSGTSKPRSTSITLAPLGLSVVF